MRAVIVHEHGPVRDQRVETLPDPVPGPGEVLIDARAIGVNYPDMLVIEGKYQVLPPRPFSPGKEVSGVVSAVGKGVTRIKVGDRVMAQREYGTYREKVVSPEATCYVMPPAMSFEEGAALGLAYQTSHFALVDRAAYRKGETVLVTGASGGVGLAGVEIAKALGATVLAGVTSPEKGEFCKTHGADHVIDLTAPDLRNSLREQVYAAIGKRGVDIVLDNVGGDAFDGALRALAWCGRLVVVGFAAGRIPEVKANYLLVKNISVVGLQWADYRERDPEWVQRVQTELYALYEAGKLKPHVSARYPLEKFADALARFVERGVQGKMILTPR
ncbi:MAG: NADPH:quinone oxidoreductase family protein [Betaproteobacteria bacterium]|jgi:NADPH2:quinone reductase|nr:NADPH:quinone oxidoreductase family protein [Betaproteobacteria bacterium]